MTFKVISGDIPHGTWYYYGGKLTKNKSITEQLVIPLEFIVDVEVSEDLRNRKVIICHLSNKKHFTAVLPAKLYEQFIIKHHAISKNTSEIDLPLKKETFTAYYVVIALLVLWILGMFTAYSESKNTEKLSKTDKVLICKNYIAMVMAKNTNALNATQLSRDGSTSIVKVWYRRSIDNTTWEYLCSIDSSSKKLLWSALFTSDSEYDEIYRNHSGSSQGRWRYEDEGSFYVSKNRAVRIETLSTDARSFKLWN